MVPLQLTVRNFLSYGPTTQTINFGPYHCICFSGRNGHGKSALLDAITWALWGQARKVSGTSKPDDALVHLGQSHMMVTLDFRVDDTTYRVRRDFTKTARKSSTHLDFGILKPDGSYASLGEKSIRGTQTKITQTLGLDYTACTTSIFLRQGDAHAFSRKSPQERKQVLAAILGLEHFEGMRRTAMERARYYSEKYQHVATHLNAYNEAHEKSSQLSKELSELYEQGSRLKQKRAALDQRYAKAEKELESSTQQANYYERYKAHYEHLQQRWHDKQTALHQARKEWRRARRKLHATEQLDVTTAERIFATYKELSKQKNEYEAIEREKHRAYQKLQEAVQRCDTMYTKICTDAYQAYEHARYEQQHEYNKHMNTYGELTQCLQELIALHAQQSTQTNATLQLSQRYAAARKMCKDSERLAAMQQRLTTRLTCTKQELARHKTRHDQITHHNVCPTCEQKISACQTHKLSTIAQRRASWLRRRHNRLERALSRIHSYMTTLSPHENTCKNLHTEYIAAQERVTALAEEIRKKRKHKHNLSTKLTQTWQTYQRSRIATAQTRKRYQRLTRQKESYYRQDVDYKKARAHYEALNKRQQSHHYDSERYQAICAQYEQYAPIYHAYEHHAYYREQANEKKLLIQTLCRDLKNVRAEMSQTQSIIQKYAQAQYHVASCRKRCHDIKQALVEHDQRHIELREAYAARREQLRACQKELQRYSQEQKNAQYYKQEYEDYTHLSNALGKNGIQAFLIEEALPEIEYEANQLLARLTNNATHVFLESQRDLKTGGTRETLDIKISDAHGIRPYELFSGGEAFRIDFALRIAISKLLTRRAGTRLQTLVIDEGFGSQDTEGLSRLTHALKAIQDDFEKIFIVSHLPSLKEQFATQFHVHKNGNGSSVTIHHHT